MRLLLQKITKEEKLSIQKTKQRQGERRIMPRAARRKNAGFIGGRKSDEGKPPSTLTSKLFHRPRVQALLC